MNKISRRALSRWAADQLEAGRPIKDIAAHIGAVLKQGRMPDQVEFLVNDIIWELEQRRSLAIGKVTTAYSLAAPLEKILSDQIKQVTGARQIVLEKKIDKGVVGGVRVETASHVWDATVARKLSELKEVF
jgi:F0F1-type ATP synthase delta subunit